MPNDTIADDIPVSFVGLLCIDENGGCSIELVINSGGEQGFIRASDVAATGFSPSCTVSVTGVGQGFIRTNLVAVAGCDRHGSFPTTLVMPFVLGENGAAFLQVQGCLFGIDEHPWLDSARTIPGVFQCHAGDAGDESSMSGQVPLVMNGRMSRQNGRFHMQQQHNTGWGSSSPLGSTNTDTGTNSGMTWGAQSCNCNGYSGTDNGQNACQCFEQQHCLAFQVFTLPFSLHSGSASAAGTSSSTDFFRFVPGCALPVGLISGRNHHREWSW